jgi:hypothetical protein
MTTGALLWYIILGIAALVFFGIALVVSILGVGDLRDLVASTRRRDTKP